MDHKQALFSPFFKPPFDNWTQIYHLNTRLVRYSDGYCIQLKKTRFVCLVLSIKETYNWGLKSGLVCISSGRKEVWLQIVQISNGILNLEPQPFEILINGCNFVKAFEIQITHEKVKIL